MNPACLYPCVELSTLQQINTSAQLGVVSELTKGALDWCLLIGERCWGMQEEAGKNK